MGHTGQAGNHDRAYRLLQRQLDRTVTGAPDSPVLMQILRLLFPEDCVELAAKLPNLPTSLEQLAARIGIEPGPLAEQLASLARRGLVFDAEHDGRRYFALAPLALGFFEFTFMRVRDDVPVAELARLFDQYMEEDGAAIRHSVFQQQTQIGRTLVREEALPDGDCVEVLDWERASHVVTSASSVAVSICACRHKASHLGRACDGPQRVCLSLNYAADALVRAGFAQKLTPAEAMRVLDEAKRSGLVQIADNVQRRVSYLCNCCPCCCEMFHALRRCNIRNAVVTSNWLARIDRLTCAGCGRCAEACPASAIRMTEAAGSPPEQDLPRYAVCDESSCLGCGICYAQCRRGALRMVSREQRVLTPETIFDRMAWMAIERGRLAQLIFDDPTRWSHRALGRLVTILEQAPPTKAVLAIQPLRSAFLARVVAAVQKHAGPLAQIVEI